MAITLAQREIALQVVMGCALNGSPIAPAGTPLTTLLPGVTPAQVWSTIATALGTSADASLTTALANYVADVLQPQLTAAQGSTTAIQAEITAATVL